MTPTPSSAPGKKSKLSDTIFAVIHLILLAAILLYAILGLAQGKTSRSLVILVCLVIYYFLVLHKAVLKEIDRKRELKSSKSPRKT
jgi:hypothetical protein